MLPNQSANNRQDIDLRRLWRFVLSKKWLIVAGTLLAGILSFLMTVYTIQPTYRSNFTVFINNRTDSSTSVTNGDTQASQSLARTFAEIIKSRDLLEEAGKAAGLPDGYASLRRMVSTSVKDETQLIDIAVVTKNPETSYGLARSIAEIAPEYIANIVDGASMKIVSSPNLPTSKYAPNVKNNTAKGAAAGFFLSLFLALLLGALDTRIQDPGYIEHVYGITHLGSVPSFSDISEEK